MKRLAILLLICFGVSCTDYDLPKPDIDESINIEQTFANTYWQRIDETSYQYSYGRPKVNLDMNDGSPVYHSKIVQYKHIGNDINTCVNYLEAYNKSIEQYATFEKIVDLRFDIKNRRAYGWTHRISFSDNMHYEIVKLSTDTIAIFDAIECIKKYKYCRRYYTVWVRFTPDQELQQRMDNATEYSQLEFHEFDQQR